MFKHIRFVQSQNQILYKSILSPNIKNCYLRFGAKCLRGFLSVAIVICRYIQNLVELKRYKYELGIIVIAKNESEYIQEWCSFHKIVGVDKIILFDNESTDNMKECLQPYIDSGFVEYHYWEGRVQQLPVYNEGLRLAKSDFKYLAFIDCDEYLFCDNKTISLKKMINNFFDSHKLAGGLFVNWKMFGSNGLISTPSGLCIENFTKRAMPGRPGTRWGKTILRTKCSDFYCHPHYPLYNLGYAGYDQFGTLVQGCKNEIKEYSEICLNHYFCKSKEQWIKRRSIGDVNGLSEKDNRTIEQFVEHDNNDVIDLAACNYVNQVYEDIKNIRNLN